VVTGTIGSYNGFAAKLFNWGSPGPSGMMMTYVDCQLAGNEATHGVEWYSEMLWCNLEDTASNVLNTTAGSFSWALNYKPYHFVQLGYGYAPTSGSVHDFLASIRGRYASGAFLTDQATWTLPVGTSGTMYSSSLWNQEYSEGSTTYTLPNAGTDAAQCRVNVII